MIQVLIEGKDAPLYHCTDMSNLASIFKDGGKLVGVHAKKYYDDDERDRIAKGKKIISATRSKRYIPFGSIQFKLDQRKLAQRYRIRSHKESWLHSPTKDGSRAVDEMEEVIVADYIDLFLYCLEIELVDSPRDGAMRSKVIKLFKSGEFMRIMENLVHSKKPMTVTSPDVEIAVLLALLKSSGKIKLGKRLNSIVPEIPDYCEKYIKTSSTKVIPKKVADDPEIKSDTNSLAEELLKSAGYTIINSNSNEVASELEVRGHKWTIVVDDRAVNVYCIREVSEDAKDYLENSSIDFQVTDKYIHCSVKHYGDVRKVINQVLNVLARVYFM